MTSHVSVAFGEYLRGARMGFHFHAGLNRWVRMECRYAEIVVRLARNSEEMGAHERGLIGRMPKNYTFWWDGETDPVTLSPALQRIAAMPDDEKPEYVVLDDAGEEIR